MKYALSAMSIAFVCFVAFFTRIEGEANFTVSFNKPTRTVEQAATEQLALVMPDVTPARKPSREE